VAEPCSMPPDPVAQAAPRLRTAGTGDRESGPTQPPEAKAGMGRKPAGAKSMPVLPLEPSPPPPPSGPAQPAITETQQPPEVVRPWWAPMGNRETASFLASCVFHTVLLLALALVVPAVVAPGSSPSGLIASTSTPVPLESAIKDDLLSIELLRRRARTGDSVFSDEVLELPKINNVRRSPAAPGSEPRADLARDPTRSSDWLLRADTGLRGGLEGRKNRAALATREGASQASEDAVERGLKWLLAHQRRNGSWNFDHTKGPCGGLCRNPGTESSTSAATAVALLAFLGAGYTHTDGQYQDAVHRGLYYLSSRGVMTPHGADFQQGTMYAQGLSAIALCEAYGMTRDPALRDLAQKAIDFIVYAQDRKGGGWRYEPQQPGDTTVTGWELMALKSGQMAGLDVPSPSIGLAIRFLDSVQADGGAQYGYMSQQPRRSTTAIGLLLRMYTGWRPDKAALRRGIEHLDKWGPSQDDIYYDYYATQVMRHWQGPKWQRWNLTMRDYLVKTQASQGHESGSWYFDGPHTRTGGRLFSTCAAIMTLEVYYRYMPLYGTKAVEKAF
jgi:hypothetical protein